MRIKDLLLEGRLVRLINKKYICGVDYLNFYFLGVLFVAWILSLFGFDNLFIDGIKELFNKEIGVASYYLIFLAIGLLVDLTILFRG